MTQIAGRGVGLETNAVAALARARVVSLPKAQLLFGVQTR
jgi:hypothetical protein